MQAPEIELKFVVDNVPAFLTAVHNLGLHLDTERTFEANTLYDTPERTLRARTEVLRLRNYGLRCVLTHKRPPDNYGGDDRYKTRVETETEVQDCVAVAEIFSRMGYGPVFRYEKYRTEWSSQEGAHLVLDETPIGVWAELEGPTGWIDSMLLQLGVKPESCSTASYGTLFSAWKEATGSPAENLTFDEAIAENKEPAMMAGS
ncbi:MAG TPA: class IV adenylate cyclase [Acidobacteriaceae bacterium]|jgi:adenylate cyclase class 2